MRILVKELIQTDATQIHDYDVKDVVFNDVKSIVQNPTGGITLIMESDEYTSIKASDYHYIQIF